MNEKPLIFHSPLQAAISHPIKGVTLCGFPVFPLWSAPNYPPLLAAILWSGAPAGPGGGGTVGGLPPGATLPAGPRSPLGRAPRWAASLCF